MNSDTDSPTPPRRFNKRRNDTSVTPAIGERINGGLISMSRILKGFTIRTFVPFCGYGVIVTGVPTMRGFSTGNTRRF
jgi:hypothetical protein